MAQGEYPLPGDIPYIAALLSPDYLGADGLSNYCDGSLITPWAVLTAAHCVVNEDGTWLWPATVRVNALDLLYDGQDGHAYEERTVKVRGCDWGGCGVGVRRARRRLFMRTRAPPSLPRLPPPKNCCCCSA